MTTRSDPFARLPPDSRGRLRKAPHPAWVDPMLATLTERRFSDPRWLFERKLDGERCLAFRDGERVRLLSRTRRTLDGTYPEVVDDLERERAADFVVDGEVVAFDRGRSSFARLQQRIGISDPARARQSPVAVFYYVFDLLHLEGHDTTALPLRARKSLLRGTLSFGSRTLRYTAHRNAAGEALFAAACAQGWEGVVAKLAEAPYVGRRSGDWLKFKCSAGQELVVGGFTEPTRSRVGLGALVVGYYQGGDLVYAGKVGTGFSQATLRELRRRLGALETPDPPFRGDDVGRAARGPGGAAVHWVRPELVAEVAFTEWTTDGRLRHPRFIGLRDDKPPRDVVREVPGAG
ncbi:MAG: non-homologous end-joining DNA ligase [Acidimicrobiales bacterium]